MIRTQVRSVRGRLPTGVAASIALVCFIVVPARGATFNAVADGNWTNGAGTWGDGVTNSGAGPQSGDTANIGGLHNIDVTSNQVFSGGGISASHAGGQVDIEITAGNTLTLDSGLFNANLPGNDARINGSGTFLNGSGATFEMNGVGNLLLGVSGTPVFQNEGTLEISSTGDFQLFNGSFVHKANAVIRRTASGEGTIGNHPTGSTASFNAESGSIFNAVDAGAVIRVDIDDPTALGTVTNATFQGNGSIEFDGNWTEISGTISGNAKVQLDGSGHVAPTGGTIYDVTGNATGLEWRAGNLTIASTRTATNNGSFSNMSAERQILGAGEFINAAGATFQYQVGATANMHIGTGGSGTTFRNQGEFKFEDASFTSNVLIHTGSASFINEATGVVRRDVAGIGVFKLHSGTANSSFRNLGTVEVTAGEIEIASSLLTASVSGGNQLTEGTWNVLSGSGTATLDLRAGGTSAGSINTIGSAAKVALGGNNPIFSQLSSTNLTVNGTFGLRDQKIYTLTSDLVAAGTLEFGLEAADEGGTLLTGLDVNGNVNFTGGSVDILDLGGLTVGTYRLIEWAGARTGLLSLGSTPSNGLVYELITLGTSSGFVELNVETASPIPEPSSLMLLSLCGAFGLVTRARRGRN